MKKRVVPAANAASRGLSGQTATGRPAPVFTDSPEASSEPPKNGSHSAEPRTKRVGVADRELRERWLREHQFHDEQDAEEFG